MSTTFLAGALAAAAALAFPSAIDADSADSVSLGGGTAGSAGVPILGFEGSPIVGNPFRMRVTGARPSAHGCVGFSAFETPIAIPFFGATVHPGFPLFALELFVTDGEGRSPVLLGVPAVDPSLCGVTFVAQGMIEDPNGPNGTTFTAGRRVTIGAVTPGPLFFGEVFEVPTGGVFGIALADFDGDGMGDVAVGTDEPDAVAIALGAPGRSFSPPALLLQPTDVVYLTAGDLNGDGFADLVWASNDTQECSVLLNQRDGTFGTRLVRPYPTNLFAPRAVRVHDLDEDGNADLVVALRRVGLDRPIVVFWGNGDGTFEEGVEVIGDGGVQVQIGDVDADGTPDLVLEEGGPLVLLGLGARAFGAPIASTGLQGSFGQTLGDFDGDGFPDLVKATKNANSAFFNRGHGDGTFAPDEVLVVRDGLAATAVDDIDGDGVVELILHDQERDQALVFDWGPSKALEQVAEVLIGTEIGAIALFDLDADGRLDLAGASRRGRGFAVVHGLGGTVFEAAPSYGTGGSARCVEAGDVDLDGDVDLVVASESDDRIVVLLNDGAGGFEIGSSYPASRPNRVLLLRLNDDPFLDVVVDSRNEDWIEIRYGVGGGDFTVPTIVPTTNEVRAIGSVVLDASGRRALVTTDEDGMLETRRILASGALGAPQTYSLLGGVGSSLHVGDLNGDGLEDLVVASGATCDVEVWLNEGSGSFASVGLIQSGLGSFGPCGGLEVLDLDLDGDNDVVLGVSNLEAGLRTFLNDGSGGLAAPQAIAGPGGYSLHSGDFDGDGIADVATANAFTGDVSVLLGDGNGALVAKGRFSAGQGPQWITVADLDGDGIDDVALACFFSRSVEVLINQLFD